MKLIMRCFGRLTPAHVVAVELAEAELALLEAHTAMEYAQSTVDYNTKRVARLRAFLCQKPSPKPREEAPT